MSTDHKILQDLVVESLNRGLISIDWLASIKKHIESNGDADWSAIAFDTNALIKIRRSGTAEVISLLSLLQGKSIPVIIPSQAVQEYWNNHGALLQNIKGLENQTRNLARDFDKLNLTRDIQESIDDISGQIQKISAELAEAENPNIIRHSHDFWQKLVTSSTIAEMPRHLIRPIGENRLISRIAPGFGDEGKPANALGDFYLWADFLYGLCLLGLNDNSTDSRPVVLVTEDAKSDWMTSGMPHPNLLAETFHLTGRLLIIHTVKSMKAGMELKQQDAKAPIA